MARSHGYRRKTRSLLRRPKGMRTLAPFLQVYHEGDEVVIDIDPAQVKGMPHRRFQGKIGKIDEVHRRSLTVNVRQGSKTKKIIARLEHIKPHQR